MFNCPYTSNNLIFCMRTTIISTSKLKTNQTIGYIILATILIATVFTAIKLITLGRIFEGLSIPIVWIFVIYKGFKMIKSLKNISYDDSSLFCEKGGFEVQVLFEEVKDIEIKTLTGIYTINLYRKDQDGDKISFKTSMWYPLNFKKQDEQVNVLRDKISQYKRALPEKNLAGLPSYKI